MNPPDIDSRLLQADEPADLAESDRFEARSVTGACYTIVELTRRGDAGNAPCYRTAYAGLPVAANDDGSFTLLDTHTRLVRVNDR